MSERLKRVGMHESGGQTSFVESKKPYMNHGINGPMLKALKSRGSLSAPQLSVNNKHCASYLDMLQHGYAHAFVLEGTTRFNLGGRYQGLVLKAEPNGWSFQLLKPKI